jgi:pimeloyl-ACP methyl ester carboxylesterase
MRLRHALRILAITTMALADLGFAKDAQREVSEQIASYLKPQLVVPIAEGRTINLVCRGHGSPTVILTAGLGGWSWVWYRIQDSLSKQTHVCASDPAGLGFSGSSSEPQDTIHETKDLEQALKGAHVNGPYVMVAHSAGAYVALRFADQHGRDVVGMVLIDPAIPNQDAVREHVAPKFAAFGNAAPTAEAKRLRQCATDLQSGILKRGTTKYDECTAPSLLLSDSALTEALAQLDADPARLLTEASAIENVSESGREVINPQRRYNDMPLIVLTSGSHPMPPDVPADVREQAALYFRALASGHDAYAALSTRGRNQVVSDSGHFIQIDNPKVVLAAIKDVLSKIAPQPMLAEQSPSPNFSGRWRIDPTKVQEHASVVPNPPQGAPAIPPPPPPDHQYTVEQIEQSGSLLKISGGEAGTTAVYTIDPSGKEVSDSIAPGVVRVAKSHWNDGRLITEWQMERNGEIVMHGTDTRSLTTDGLQVVDRLIESPRHHGEVHLVMQRVS